MGGDTGWRGCGDRGGVGWRGMGGTQDVEGWMMWDMGGAMRGCGVLKVMGARGGKDMG